MLPTEIDNLRNASQTLEEKIARLNNALAIENDVAIKFKLEKQLEEAELERTSIDEKIKELERIAVSGLNVFICFPSDEGAEIVDRLSESLRRNGIENSRREKEFDPHDGLPSDIREKISNSTHVLVCLTGQIEKTLSAFQLEVSFSIFKNKSILALVFPNAQKPVQIITYPEVDFSNWDSGVKAVLYILTGSRPRRSLSLSTDKYREAELEYLQSQAQKYDVWRTMYTEMTLSGRFKEPKIKLRPEAMLLLERTHQVSRKISHAFEEDSANKFTISTFEELTETFHKFRRVALIGDPGAGKTTTLQRSLYELASVSAKSLTQPLPLFARLSEYDGGEFDSFLRASFNGFDLHAYLPNRIVLLLDGLNEMPYSFMPKVEAWIQRNPDVSMIVACRKLEYLERKLPLFRVDILPLDVGQIHKFISNFFAEREDCDRLFWALAGKDVNQVWDWFNAVEPDATFENFWLGNIEYARSYEVEKSKLKQIQEDLRSSGKLPGLLGVVSNPFLLRAVIEIYSDTGRPPENKGELFNEFVDTLLEKCARVATKQNIPWVDENTQRQAMARLAYQMQIEKKGTSVPIDWATETLKKAMPGQEANTLLYLAASARIIERSDTVRFTHQLLQEYFAAYELGEDMRRGVPASKFWPGENWWETTGWEETALLLAGIEGDATEVVAWLTPVHPTLAFLCATESGVPCKNEALVKLYEPDPKARISPLARAEWGRKLAVIGDTRLGVGLNPVGIPDVVWCEVPAGEFRMGGDPELDVLGIAWEGGVIDIPYTFWIAKYPVTYAQFEAFVRDGYENQKYWSSAGWRWKGNQAEPRLWRDPILSLPNHPIVGVTWYEAYAFSNWFNEKLHDSGLENPNLAEEWVVRLPLECEWEKAARYPDGRKYPWGEKYIAGYANIDETFEDAVSGPYFLRRSTAVGMYPQGESACGALDMCGNVWEWCLSKWKILYEFPEDTNTEGTEHRGVRGGSWYNSRLFAPAAAHDCQDADLGVNDVGFRLILAKADSLRSFNTPNIKLNGKASTLKIFVAGLQGSGKTEFIKTISDLPLVSVEKKIVSNGKLVQMDYGRVAINRNMLYMYAPVSETDYSFLWESLHLEMHGSIILFDATDRARFKEVAELLGIFQKTLGVPKVVVATKSDLLSGFNSGEDFSQLPIDSDSILLCNSRKKQNVRHVLTRLLPEITDRLV